MFGLGMPEVVIILLAIAVLFFGSGKITELARSIGRVSGEFRKGKHEIESELKATEQNEHRQ